MYCPQALRRKVIHLLGQYLANSKTPILLFKLYNLGWKKHLEDFNTAITLSTGEEAEFIAEVVRSFQGPWEDDICLDSSLDIGHLDLT